MAQDSFLAGVMVWIRAAARAWHLGRWAGFQYEFRKRATDQIGSYARRFLIESDLTRLAEVAPPEAVEVRLLAEPEWSLLRDVAPLDLAQRYEEASASGRICLVAWKQRQVVGYAWFSPHVDVSHEGYDLPLPSDAIFVWQLEVSPEERGHGVASALLSTGLQLARDRGLRRSWIVVHPDNLASLRTVASVSSSHVLGVVTRLKLLAWIRSRYRVLSAPVPIDGTLSR